MDFLDDACWRRHRIGSRNPDGFEYVILADSGFRSCRDATPPERDPLHAPPTFHTPGTYPDPAGQTHQICTAAARADTIDRLVPGNEITGRVPLAAKEGATFLRPALDNLPFAAQSDSAPQPVSGADAHYGNRENRCTPGTSRT